MKFLMSEVPLWRNAQGMCGAGAGYCNEIPILCDAFSAMIKVREGCWCCHILDVAPRAHLIDNDISPHTPLRLPDLAID